MKKPDKEYWLQNEQYIELLTSQAVGFPVKVYNGDDYSVTGLRQAGGYQIMPEAVAAFLQAWQTYSRRAT